MIKISLFVKGENKKENFVEKSSFSIERPKTYEDLISKIKNKFNISNDDFALRVFDEDQDECININYDEQYNDPKYKAKTNYNVLLEENPPKIDENIFEFIDRTLNLKNDLLIDDTELFDKIDFNTKSSEANNLGLSIKELMNENFNEEKTEQNELYNYFIDDFSKKISSQTEEQKKLFIETINKDLLNVDKVINENVDEFNKQIKFYSENINILHNDINELKNIIINNENVDQQKKKEEEERKKREEEEQKRKEKEEQKRKEEEDQKKKEEEEQKKKEEEEQKKKEEEERKKKEEEERKKKEEDERKKKEEEERKKKEEDEKKKKEEEDKKEQKPEKLEINSKEKYIIEDTNASDILVQVKVKNVSEKKVSLKNKKWIKGKKSNEVVEFFNGIDEININEELEENKEKNIDVHFSIKNPQQGLNYNVELFIGNTKDNNEIDIITDNALCFNVEITKKDPDDPNTLTPEKIEEIYQALDDSYIVSNFMDKQELIEKIKELKGDMDSLIKYVEELI